MNMKSMMEVMLFADGSPTKVVGRGKVRLMLRDGRRRTLPIVLHIPGLARNIVFINKMSNARLHTIFEKDSCKMVHGEMVLMRGV